MYDLIIKGGKIIDGSGTNAYFADMAIKDGFIAEIADPIDKEAKSTINCAGCAVCPGFIDIHSHSDFSLMYNPRAESKVRQGITTEVVGNCGFTPAPVNQQHFNDLMQYLVNTVAINDEEKKDWKYRSQREFLNTLKERGLALNIASLAGHGTIKIAAMGFEREKPSAAELGRMLSLLEKELEQGIFGMSTGLQYEPGVFASFDELSEMAKLVRDYGGIYSTHLKSEGKFLLECIDEAIELADKTGVSLEISHLKAQNPSNWDKTEKALDIIDGARRCGVDVDFDVYPYTAFGSGLMDLLPPWVREEGSAKMVRLLKDSRMRNRIAQDMACGLPGWENPMEGIGWDKVRVASLATECNRGFEGSSILQISDMMNCTPAQAVMELLCQEEGAVKMIFFGMSEENLITIMKHPRAIFGTDGRALAPYGRLGSGKPHPRYYGTYPRILGHYVRELKVLSIQEAVKKMTFLPAQKIGLRDRGLLKVGYCADITVLDENEIKELATYDNPHNYPKGIISVIVNGRIVVWQGSHTGELPGIVLSRRALKTTDKVKL